MPEAYIVEAVRTAVGKRNGSLAGVHPIDLGAGVFQGLFDRVDVDPAAVDDVIVGCVDAIGGQAGHWPAGVAGGRRSGRGSRRHRRPAMRLQPAGYFLWRTGDHGGHR